jgi:hypothetical protein
MIDNIYFGKLIAELFDQNEQGRFFDTSSTLDAEVYEQRRHQIFEVRFGHFSFTYDLSTGHYEFVDMENSNVLPKLVTQGWDGLTKSQKLAFISTIYDFLYKNRMTDAALEEFIRYLSTPSNH